MPDNGSGVYTVPPGSAGVANSTIESAKYNTLLADLAAALSARINADGQKPFTGNQPMANHKFTSLAAGTSAGDSVRYEQSPEAITTTRGDILVRGASAIARLAVGTARQVITTDGTDVLWGANSPITTRGDLSYGDSSGMPDRLAIGTANQILTTDGTDVAWGDLIRHNIQGGFKNLKIVTADGGTGPVVTADQVTVENSAGYSMRISGLNVTMDFTGTGAGKLDTGSIATSKFYFIWAIAKDDGTKSAVGSLSASSPTMPVDYTYKALIGAVLTKSGSAVFYGSTQYGDTVQYTSPPEFCTGAQGTYGSAWSSSISVAGFVPISIASAVDIIAVATSAANILIAPNAGYSTAYASGVPPLIVATTSLPCYGRIILEGTGVFVSSQASTKALVLGYKMNL